MCDASITTISPSLTILFRYFTDGVSSSIRTTSPSTNSFSFLSICLPYVSSENRIILLCFSFIFSVSCFDLVLVSSVLILPSSFILCAFVFG
jgi:hypothetical protein